jgi:N-sulfoglucosamine sulfohydrolase
VTLADRPNVLYLHSHDTGRYVQPYGHAVPTPAIQRLAEQGVLFRRAFATAATCSGSRAALLTGQYPHVNGMTGLAHRGWELNDVRRHVIHTLRTAGYHSELIGEQHVSETPDVLGYDRFYDIASNHVAQVAPIAIGALERMPEPFFLSVGFFETHRRFSLQTSDIDERYSLPPSNLPDLPDVRRDMAEFLASARSLDDGVAQVLAALDRTGLAERTLVIFTTDHGLPFPGAKATLFDRGLGVSLILRGPGGFEGGRVCEAMVSHLDIFPTLCDLAGLEHPDHLHGSSLLPLVRGEADTLHDELFAEITFHAAYEPQRAVRTDRFKLIRRFAPEDGPVLPNVDDGPTKDALVELGWFHWAREEERLHDVLLDPHETSNLIAEPAYAAVAGDLRRRLHRWMAETNDPLLRGPVELPPRGRANAVDQRSAEEPLVEFGAELRDDELAA